MGEPGALGGQGPYPEVGEALETVDVFPASLAAALAHSVRGVEGAVLSVRAVRAHGVLASVPGGVHVGPGGTRKCARVKDGTKVRANGYCQGLTCCVQHTRCHGTTDLVTSPAT